MGEIDYLSNYSNGPDQALIEVNGKTSDINGYNDESMNNGNKAFQ